jgi:tRNA(Ile)-lysidine synthase
VRYKFLAEVAERLGTPYIATGHTRSDQAETILLHIVRGTGIRGLVGLKPLTPWTLDGRKIALVRPLLGIGRQETEDYCRRFELEPRLDITNLSLMPLRNRIRLELLPQLSRYNQGIEEALLRLAAAADDDIKYLDEKVSEVWDKVVTEQADVIALDRAAMLVLPPALRSYVLRRAMERLLGNIKDIEMRHIDDIMSTLDLPAGRRIDLPYGLIFLVDYGKYWLGTEQAIPSPYPALDGEYHLAIPGVTDIPGWRIEAMFVQGYEAPGVNSLTAYLDADSAGQALNVRAWKRGDRFVPLGLDSEKKLGEFMIDQKIPRHWRKNIPLVVSPERVVWLVGCRLDARVRVTDKTGRVLRLEFRRI